MALTRQQQEILYLGGTVKLPADDLGFLSVDDGGVATLRIESTPQNGRVARTVALDQVVAIFIPSDPDNREIGTWLYRDLDHGITLNTFQAVAQPKTAGNNPLGVVYVRPDTPVLVEAGVGAAESENFATSMMMYPGCNG